MGKITRIIFMDNVKSRVVVVYFVLLALLSWTSLLLQDNESKGALTVLNIILFVTPLMSLLYTVTYRSIIKFADSLLVGSRYPNVALYKLVNRIYPRPYGLCQHAHLRVLSIPHNHVNKRQNTRNRCINPHLALTDNDL